MSRKPPRNALFGVSIAYMLVVIALAALAPWIAPQDPLAQDLDTRLQAPRQARPLGTDEFGRDVLSRIIYGTRPTLAVTVIAVLVAGSLGLIVGLIAGLSEGFLEASFMLLMDGVLSFPTVLLAITLVTFLGYGLVQVMLAIGVVFTPLFARLVRAETLSVKTAGYVEAARSLGSSWIGIVVRHIVPNMAGKLIVQAFLTGALCIVIESSLSYLGLGTQPPNPSWGLMLKSAQGYLIQAPWMAIYPGLAIALTVLSLNIMGDALAERLNPRLKK